ncbi:hypothetical protein ARV1_gp39 [Acidianus rod-shaped virus 1]|uniref:Uncharacterized protein n=1 Tax=Acidianus rod-shaped virus 1 TaxID=309181 RepID=Q50I32_9VIRU|nr:hypothetical protein ARV1_gp03 [Acidianus rod-shaped virus 1]YP_001542656.1 hypothetical protein ARV1_gp39 [Acidianus rod-shaped virus 1]CAI44158.1 hypothetical protein [Acidianus rod-shaped virus 1]CAI44194.1 hypothetical protein [Acidianus rod-shaped virus 1]
MSRFTSGEIFLVGNIQFTPRLISKNSDYHGLEINMRVKNTRLVEIQNCG